MHPRGVKLNPTAVFAALLLATGTPTADQPQGFQRTQHPEAQWFPTAGLGLFVHWGISSVAGTGELSWSMLVDVPWQRPEQVMTPNQYFALAKRFKPSDYDPDKWLRAARDMGCTYAVLTTRHHDGYALWPSKYGDFSTRNYLGGRDLVAPFVQACRRNGMKVGLYYSPPDWHYNRNYMSFRYGNKPGGPLGLDHEPVTLPSKPEGWDEKYRAYIKGQVEELLTRYGKIDLIWFDGGPDAISIERIRELQPGIVINPRMHGHGDFLTPEWDFPKERPQGWWENCASWLGGWGYRKAVHYQSAGWMLERLTKVRSWGGNLLINVAPGPDGTLPDEAYQRMEEVRRWMEHSRGSIVGALPGPWPERCNAPVTTKPDAFYLHVPPGFKDAVMLAGVEAPTNVKLLRTGDDLPYKFEDGRLEVTIPAAKRTSLVDVIEVHWQPRAF